MRNIANVDGIITAAEEAKISILDRGFLYGDSIYEVFRTYDGVPFLYEEHFLRLWNSAKLAVMKITQTEAELWDEIRRTCAAAEVKANEEVYVRIAITRGVGPIDLNLRRTSKTSFVILVKDMPAWKPELYSEGVKLAVTDLRRNPSNALDPNIKGGNYLNNILGVEEALTLGADDVFFRNLAGDLTEASNSNVLFVRDGKVFTPDLKSGNLNGTTKNFVGRLCQGLDIPFSHQRIGVDDIRDANECFVTSATREIMPVRSLRLPDGNWLEFPQGGGAFTRKLRSAFAEKCKEYVAQHRKAAILLRK